MFQNGRSRKVRTRMRGAAPVNGRIRRVGVPREIKRQEYRVGVTPAGVEELVRRGVEVIVEKEAGLGSGIADAEFAAAGATIAPHASAVWAGADLVVKVKEPLPEEWPRMRAGQLVFTYFHFAA